MECIQIKNSLNLPKGRLKTYNSKLRKRCE
jgi:hypothetical protein